MWGSIPGWLRSGGFWEGLAVALGEFSLAAQETSLPGKQDGRLQSGPWGAWVWGERGSE